MTSLALLTLLRANSHQTLTIRVYRCKMHIDALFIFMLEVNGGSGSLSGQKGEVMRWPRALLLLTMRQSSARI